MINTTDYTKYYTNEVKSKRKKMPLEVIAKLSIAKENEVAFVCPICRIRYTMNFGVFSKTRKNFAESAYHCRLCVKRYELIKM